MLFIHIKYTLYTCYCYYTKVYLFNFQFQGIDRYIINKILRWPHTYVPIHHLHLINLHIRICVNNNERDFMFSKIKSRSKISKRWICWENILRFCFCCVYMNVYCVHVINAFSHKMWINSFYCYFSFQQLVFVTINWILI